jgi:hypothetical protein
MKSFIFVLSVIFASKALAAEPKVERNKNFNRVQKGRDLSDVRQDFFSRQGLNVEDSNSEQRILIQYGDPFKKEDRKLSVDRKKTIFDPHGGENQVALIENDEILCIFENDDSIMAKIAAGKYQVKAGSVMKIEKIDSKDVNLFAGRVALAYVSDERIFKNDFNVECIDKKTGMTEIIHPDQIEDKGTRKVVKKDALENLTPLVNGSLALVRQEMVKQQPVPTISRKDLEAKLIKLGVYKAKTHEEGAKKRTH